MLVYQRLPVIKSKRGGDSIRSPSGSFVAITCRSLNAEPYLPTQNIAWNNSGKCVNSAKIPESSCLVPLRQLCD